MSIGRSAASCSWGCSLSLDLVEHPVHEDRRLVKRVIGALRRQAFAQFAGDDTLDLPVDFLHPPLRANAQEDSGCQAETRAGIKPTASARSTLWTIQAIS
jgi:hypothetical protein